MTPCVSLLCTRPGEFLSRGVPDWAGLGVQALELVPGLLLPSWPAIVPGEVDAARRALDRTGIPLRPAMQGILFGRPEADLFSAPPLFVRAVLDAGRVAAELGCPRLVWGAPRQRRRGGISHARATEAATSPIRAAAEGLERLGVDLLMENNPEAYGCDWGRTPDEVLEVVDAVGHPRFGLHLDIGGLEGRDPAPWLARARHVHASELHLAPFAASDAHRAAAAALKGAGISLVSLEMLPPPSGDASGAVRAFIETYGELGA